MDVEKGVDLKNIRISVNPALVLKVRVFGTRKWPIIISDGSGRIKVYRPGLYGLLIGIERADLRSFDSNNA